MKIVRANNIYREFTMCLALCQAFHVGYLISISEHFTLDTILILILQIKKMKQTQELNTGSVNVKCPFKTIFLPCSLMEQHSECKHFCFLFLLAGFASVNPCSFWIHRSTVKLVQYVVFYNQNFIGKFLSHSPLSQAQLFLQQTFNFVSLFIFSPVSVAFILPAPVLKKNQIT